MTSLFNLIDFIIHIDKYLALIIQNYGLFTYIILFIIIFLETGLVITPFLPGDSLIFLTGAFAAQGVFNIVILFLILVLAAVLGDTVNYWIGNYFGDKVFSKSSLFRREYLDKTKQFYRKYGGKTIIYARFIPIIRTFAPFVAGIGAMDYTRFLIFNVIGALSWVLIFLLGGYFFGRVPIVKDNLTIVILLIILISILPPLIEYLRHKLRR